MDYHLRRSDRKIRKEEEIQGIINRSNFMTLALCREGQPYLVTLSYAYDKEKKCFYFHCADEGKKIDYLKDNNRVWGQILEDLGYKQGECTHGYRTVHFKGKVEFITVLDEKRTVLSAMVDWFEKRPAMVKKRLIEGKNLEGIVVGKIAVEKFMGKKNE